MSTVWMWTPEFLVHLWPTKACTSQELAQENMRAEEIYVTWIPPVGASRTRRENNLKREGAAFRCSEKCTHQIKTPGMVQSTRQWPWQRGCDDGRPAARTWGAGSMILGCPQIWPWSGLSMDSWRLASLWENGRHDICPGAMEALAHGPRKYKHTTFMTEDEERECIDSSRIHLQA